MRDNRVDAFLFWCTCLDAWWIASGVSKEHATLAHSRQGISNFLFAEQHHLCGAFHVLRDHNFMPGIPKPDYLRLRKVLSFPCSRFGNFAVLECAD